MLAAVGHSAKMESPKFSEADVCSLLEGEDVEPRIVPM